MNINDDTKHTWIREALTKRGYRQRDLAKASMPLIN